MTTKPEPLFFSEVSEKVVTLRKNPLVFKAKHQKPLNTIEEYINLNTENTSTVLESIHNPTRVLIVDDDQINLLVARGYLDSMEDGVFLYETANNGLEALDIIINKKSKEIYFDVILMDCNMPVIDGFQASCLIKKMEKAKEIPYVPIVAITANVAIADKDKCLKHGMDYFLPKPYKKNQLYQMIKHACRLKYNSVKGREFFKVE